MVMLCILARGRAYETIMSVFRSREWCMNGAHAVWGEELGSKMSKIGQVADLGGGS